MTTDHLLPEPDSEETLRLYRALLDSSDRLGHMCYWILDYATQIYRGSESFTQLLGWPEGTTQLSEAEFASHIHSEDLPRLIAARRAATPDDRLTEVEYRFWKTTEQRWLNLRSILFFLRNAQGKPVSMYGFTQDITQQKESEDRLRLSASVFLNSRSLIVITDRERNILQVNPAFCEHTGYSEDEVIGRTPLALISDELPASAMRIDIWQPLIREGHWSGEISGHSKDGTPLLLSVGVSALCNDKGEVEHYICVGEDITRTKAAEEQVRQLAYYDALTGLPNRVLLKDRVDQAISLAHRAGCETALLFVDLDYFKRVNDSLGHAVGDLLLVEVAARLRAAVRASDTVGRLGGDEFLLLLPYAGPQAASSVAEKLIEALSQPFEVGGYSLTVTPTIGISLYPKDGCDYDTLLRAADAAMYKAKEAGRNAFLLFSPEMNEGPLQRLMLSNDLRQALKNGELELHYQPQLSLPGGRVLGAEALLRWRHPKQGMISPLKFVPVAEESGLIETIGAWVIEEACRQAAAWSAPGVAPLTVAVNCSARQFVAPEALLNTVKQALAASGLPPQRLELEITESLIVKDINKTQWLLDQFRTLGVKVAIDDFGTGYSSLYYLKRLPIDKLKIDQSFVRDLANDADDRAIAATVIALGHTLGLRVIAEGVESAEQLRLLEQMGCDEGQGFLWGRAMPSADFADWLHARPRIE
jgi:diguanylate cyclase (GGDEF)-like protein/PAS domain S-box-containing protein